MIGNSELQERMAEQMEFALSQTPEALAAENAELRELVQKAVAFVSDEDPCGHCGHDAECYAQNGLNVAYEGGCLMLDLLTDQARELGIEVDG